MSRSRAVLLFPLLLAAAASGCPGSRPASGTGGKTSGDASQRAQPAAGGLVTLGGLGTDDGRFFYPRSAAVNARGELAVVDRSGRIQWFSREGALLASFKLPVFEKGQPTGINFSRKGELLVADSHYHRLLAYGDLPLGPSTDPKSAGGAPPLLRTWGTEGDGDGQFTLVRDIIEDSRGCLYAGDYDGPTDRIEKFTPEGTFLLTWGRRGPAEGEFQRPQGMALERLADGREFILVADSCNHRVQRFTTEGKFESAFGRIGSGPGELKYPYGVASGGAGSAGEPFVFVCEWGNNRVQRFHRDGRPAGSWGRAGREAGELSTPWDVTLGLDGALYVVDYGNHRVQILPPDLQRFD